MKTCINCNHTKELSEFYKSSVSKDKHGVYCKICQHSKANSYRKTIKGVLSSSYDHNKQHSKKRNHKMPTYTRSELYEWAIKQKKFHELFRGWVNSNYHTELKPSIDRLDDNKGYSFQNIQILTWAENKLKRDMSIREGKKFNLNDHKKVKQFTKGSKLIKIFVSAIEAQRETRVSQGNISAVCRGVRKTAGGFRWEFA